MPLPLARVLTVLTVATVSTACSGAADRTGSRADTAARGSITVTSEAFTDGARIPEQFTCNGAGTPPPLSWTGLPSDTESVAVVVVDPDAPGGTFVHWVLVGVPPGQTDLADGTVPAGATQARNSSGTIGWTPPCPPSGTHHYRFTVYALEGSVDVSDGADPEAAVKAVEEIGVAEGTLTGIVSAE